MTKTSPAGQRERSANKRRSAAVRRISIVCGSVLHYDAISECALAHLEAVTMQQKFADPVEVRIYCLGTNVADSRIYVLESSRDLIAEKYYQNSDLIIYHFGIFSEIHHSLATAPRSACVVVHFHGVTPPQFMPAKWEHLISSSFIQIGLFSAADEIVVNSAYLREELVRMGISVPLRQIDLFGSNIAEIPSRKHDLPGHKGVNIVYCGRFVASKQVIPLIDALECCVDDFDGLTLTLIGVKQYSDPVYLDEIERHSKLGRLDVVFAFDLEPAQVTAAMSTADLVALPSLHEGFGMPVAEALAALTPVLCSDAGSLPEVSGGLALLFKAGDHSSLKIAIRDALRARVAGNVLTERGVLSYDDWVKLARAFSSKYRRSEFVARWQAYIREKLAKTEPVGLPSTAKVDALEYMFRGAGGVGPVEAQLLGRLVMIKALSRLGRGNKTGAMDALYRWAFGHAADHESLNNWLKVYNRSGTVDDVVSQMSSEAQEVKTSHFRVRSLAGLTSVLTENVVSANNNSKSDEPHELPTMSRVQVEYIAQSETTSEGFIRSLYANIFKRLPDPEGLSYWANIAADHDTWTSVVDSFYEILEVTESEDN